jgi:hypothetical protein
MRDTRYRRRGPRAERAGGLQLSASPLLALALGYCAWVCGILQSEVGQAAIPYADISQRTTNEFAEACFFKPAETKTNEQAFTLAPLILQEVNAGSVTQPGTDRFGTVRLAHGFPTLDRLRPAVYWQADTVRLKGKEHVRFAYVWCYSTDASGHGGAGLALQGVRITLNSAGQPAIWEVLADSSGAEVIFVSQSVEAAALAEYGRALPGRHYGIERRVEDAPKVIVARVIDDGPVAMGPFVYLSAGTREVSTIICRCMPAQAKKLLFTSAYVLVPFQAEARLYLTQAKVLAREETAYWPGDERSDNRLEHGLRLPSAF